MVSPGLFLREGENDNAPGPGGEPSSVPPATDPLVSSVRLAVMMFIGAEAMFFAGLIGAFIVFRIASPLWPPPFQPRLPIFVTGISSVILLMIGVTMSWAMGSLRRGDLAKLVRWLGTTLGLGTVFLLVQGFEWTRLIRFGLTLSSGIYGSTFYTLIGCHALHVLGSVVWLSIVLHLARRGRFTAERRTGVEVCGMYWFFVVGLWPVLYGLVYLY